MVFLLQVPYQVHLTTRAFYRALSQDEQLREYAEACPIVSAKTKTSILDHLFDRWRTIATVATVVVIALAVVCGIYFDQLFRPSRDTEVVAHRAGGFAAPENSISGLEHAISLGVDWVEVDVQRTADGHYILNHDESFQRVARDPRSAPQLSLSEIKQLNIGLDGKTERVPELREFLQAADGQVNVILELKGSTADRQMVDDVVAIIEQLEIADATMVMSLNYDLIAYLDDTYPDITSGFAYFLAFGDVTQLAGDYLIFEEREATNTRLRLLQVTGRKSMVWTVNQDDSVERFATADVSAIITDVPELVRFKLDEARNESDTDVFLRYFIGIGG